MADQARQASQAQWLRDLRELRSDAKARFADVSWEDGNGGIIYAHKAIVYSRAAGSFQLRYLSAPFVDIHGTAYSLSRGSVTPSASGCHDDSTLSEHSHDRCNSPRSIISRETHSAGPLSLSGTDPALFEACLDHLYTGETGAEGVAVLFDGFGEGVRDEARGLDGSDKLSEDLLYSWRSKLFSDVVIALDDVAETTFAAHRAILCSRSPYFQSLLLGSYGDSHLNHFTLPSPPFTAASTTFILGYIYSGTLTFSSRKFDLTTAFEIWRGADFLSLALLQEEITIKIEAMVNLQRAARVYAFALAPDVKNHRLARIAEPWVTARFGDTWGSPHIGNLDYEAQKKLVRDVCSLITPTTLTSTAKALLSLRRRLDLEKSIWAEHVAAMLRAIEDELVSVLSRDLVSTVRSQGFVDLVDGVGFSTDVLEWILELVIRGLGESNAPIAYQALVGSVLLREEGILIDAKVLIEDARNGILKYIERKWTSIREARGFVGLDTWSLKELSDEIEVPLEDLLAEPSRLGHATARAELRARLQAGGSATRSVTTASGTQPRALLTGSLSTKLSSSSSSRPSATRPRVAATNGSSSTHPSSRTGIAAEGPRSAPAAAEPLSRIPPSQPRGSNGRGPSTTVRRPTSGSTSSATIAPIPGHAARPTPTLAAPSRRPRQAQPSSAAHPRSASASVVSSAPSMRSARSVATSLGTSASANGPLPSKQTARVAIASSSQRTVDALPSLASRPSTSSLTSSSSTGRLSASRTLTRPLKPAVGESPTFSARPTASTLVGPSTLKGKSRAVLPTTDSATRRPSSVASSRSATTLRRPRSASSVSSLRAPETSVSRSNPSGSTANQATPRRAVAKSSPVKPTPVMSLKGTAGVATSSAPVKSSSGSTSREASSPSTRQTPGTTILSGIPCIVIVNAERPMRFRATVRYIGEVCWGIGEWIGVEVAEAALPPEVPELEWNDGEVQGVCYFRISASSARSSGSTTPTPIGDDSPSANDSTGCSGASSLRPPSRRQRRSSSTGPERESGPRRGLFVRPSQIVYVL